MHHGGLAGADQEPAERQSRRMSRERQDQGAGQGDDGGDGHRPPCAEPVEGEAHRHLDQRRGERHGAHDQADLGRAQAEHAVQLGGDHAAAEAMDLRAHQEHAGDGENRDHGHSAGCSLRP